MKDATHLFLNMVFFGLVVIIALVIGTLSLAQKVNEYRAQAKTGIKVTVEKENVPVISYSSGVVKKVHIKTGSIVKKGDLLVEIDNPELRSKVNVLQKYKDNVSAQTEAKVALEQLKFSNITSPVSGIVSDVSVSEGSPIDERSKVGYIYANEGAKLLSELTVEQYHLVEDQPTIQVFSPRLKQTFTVKRDSLRPNESSIKKDDTDKRLGLYFKFTKDDDIASLLHNEDLDLLINQESSTVKKPVDHIVDFWNQILNKEL